MPPFFASEWIIEMKTKHLSVIGLLLVLFALPAYGFNFSPIVADFEPSGPGARQTFRLTNPNADSIPVEITVFERRMTVDGQDVLEPSDDFVVFPTQAILAAESSRVVRVQYVGPADINTEKAYRIIAEQLPVDLEALEEGTARLNLLFRYVGSMYVVPTNAASDVVIESVERVDVEGILSLAIVLHNHGNAHAILEDLVVELSTRPFASTDGVVRLDGDELEGMRNQNVLAGHTRRFVLPLPTELALTSGRLNARMSYSPTR